MHKIKPDNIPIRTIMIFPKKKDLITAHEWLLILTDEVTKRIQLSPDKL